MLSPGKWHLKVPREKVANLRFRRRLLEMAANDRQAQLAIIECCRRDLLFYVNTFVWCYDPRTRSGKIIGAGPFICYPFQDGALLTILECIEAGQDLVIEKSRDMGASWMSLIVMEWLWHFHAGTSFMMVSRKEELVDSPGDPDSLFWKVDHIHRHLPGWLRPDVDRRRLHFGNLENGSTIDGESTTAAAGVGGRRTAMFIDEFSRIEEGYQLLAGTADTTGCRIFNFTPWGTNNASHKLAMRKDVRKLRLYWADHPEKNKGLYRYNRASNKVEVIDTAHQFPPDYRFDMDGKFPYGSVWFDAERRRRANDREMAQMVEIDYQGSEYQFFDSLIINDLIREFACAPYWEGDISFDRDTGRPNQLVQCAGGPLRLWMNPDSQGKPPIGRYGCGADISFGTGATNSCLSIVDGATGEKVGEYTTPHMRPEEFALRCVALCWILRDGKGETAAFAWEKQGPGAIFGKKVIELGYRNVYYRTNENNPMDRPPADSPGWTPLPDNKRILLEEYRTALWNRQLVNRSEEALKECLEFVHKSTGAIEHSGESDTEDPSGAKGNHGDRVIADALAHKMVKSKPGKKEEHEEPREGSMAWRRQLADQRQKLEESWA